MEEIWTQLMEGSDYELSNFGNVRVRVGRGRTRPVAVYDGRAGGRFIMPTRHGHHRRLYLEPYMDALYGGYPS